MVETITDLANDILLCKEWNHQQICSPHFNRILEAKSQPDSIPFASAFLAHVYVPPTKHGKIDGYIDDLLSVMLDINENSSHGSHAVPLAMHTVGRPL